MIYRNGYWDMPKGKMEAGETPAQTALREVEEECGVKNLKIVKPLISTYHIFSQNKKECIKRTYWFEMTCRDPNKPIPQKEEGILEARWAPKEEVKKNIEKMYLSLQDVVATTFSF
jgi:8-oxo-dGTP pyrophosphatase MutT (NUDIX family)